MHADAQLPCLAQALTLSRGPYAYQDALAQALPRCNRHGHQHLLHTWQILRHPNPRRGRPEFLQQLPHAPHGAHERSDCMRPNQHGQLHLVTYTPQNDQKELEHAHGERAGPIQVTLL